MFNPVRHYGCLWRESVWKRAVISIFTLIHLAQSIESVAAENRYEYFASRHIQTIFCTSCITWRVLNPYTHSNLIQSQVFPFKKPQKTLFSYHCYIYIFSLLIQLENVKCFVAVHLASHIFHIQSYSNSRRVSIITINNKGKPINFKIISVIWPQKYFTDVFFFQVPDSS